MPQSSGHADGISRAPRKAYLEALRPSSGLRDRLALLARRDVARHAWACSPQQRSSSCTVTWLIGKPSVTRVAQGGQHRAVGRALLQDGVGREGVDARGQRPDVQVVDGPDAGHRPPSPPAAPARSTSRGVPSSSTWTRLPQQGPRAGQDEERDRDRDQGVHPEPAGRRDHHRPGDHADRGQRVGQDLVVGPAHVEAVARARGAAGARRPRSRAGRRRRPPAPGTRRHGAAGCGSAPTPRRGCSRPPPSSTRALVSAARISTRWYP